MKKILAAIYRTLVEVFSQPDKQSHFFWGAAMGLSALWYGWTVLFVIAVIAAAKEAYDHAHPPHRAELWDFLSTIIGAAIAVALILERLHHHG